MKLYYITYLYLDWKTETAQSEVLCRRPYRKWKNQEYKMKPRTIACLLFVFGNSKLKAEKG